MMNPRNSIKQRLLFYCVFFLLFFSSPFKSFSDEIKWVEVSKSSNSLIFIDPNSINYNNKGFLSVKTKYSEINPEDHNILSTDSYLMAIDCEKRLFSRLPINSELKQVRNWENPINDKMIKTTIIKSCSY